MAAISAHFLLLILAWCRPGCIILDTISIVKQVTRAHVIDLEVLCVIAGADIIILKAAAIV